MGQSAYIHGIGFGSDQLAELRATRVLVVHVLDEMRQLVAGIDPLEVLAAVDVVSTVDHPVNIEDQRSISPQRAGAATDLLVSGNCRLTTAVMLAG